MRDGIAERLLELEIERAMLHRLAALRRDLEAQGCTVVVDTTLRELTVTLGDEATSIASETAEVDLVEEAMIDRERIPGDAPERHVNMVAAPPLGQGAALKLHAQLNALPRSTFWDPTRDLELFERVLRGEAWGDLCEVFGLGREDVQARFRQLAGPQPTLERQQRLLRVLRERANAEGA